MNKRVMCIVALLCLASPSVAQGVLRRPDCHSPERHPQRGVALARQVEADKDVFPGHDGHIGLPTPEAWVRDHEAHSIYAIHGRSPAECRPTHEKRLQLKTATYELSCDACVWHDHDRQADLYGDIVLTVGQTRYRLTGNWQHYDRTQNVVRLDGLARIVATTGTTENIQTGDQATITLGQPPALPQIAVR